MNDRERFYATMHYCPRDRAPIMDFSFWNETLPRWQGQGLPPHVTRSNSDEFFGMDAGMDAISNATGVNAGLCPLFDEIVLQDRGEEEVVQQKDGVRVLRRKSMVSIPQHLAHLLVDRDSWRQHYQPRLDPTHPARLPNDWVDRVKVWRDGDREQVIALPGGSFCGWLRDWMGLEKFAMTIYDDPAWFEEMVTTIADCVIGTVARLLETGGRFDACAIWEDIAYNRGPLLSPQHFKRYLVPQYRRLADLLHKHSVDVVWVDCDGKIDQLIPLWLDAGVNCMFPLEIGTWGADPVSYRLRYGKELLLMGGFDKHILAQSQTEIQAEVERLAPLVEEGGYIGFCDHRVPPDVPLDNYVFYLKTIRRIWGHDTNLRPMGPC